MTSILLLVQIVLTRFTEKDFETTFATWENNVNNFEEAIGKELYPEIKLDYLSLVLLGNYMIIYASLVEKPLTLQR